MKLDELYLNNITCRDECLSKRLLYQEVIKDSLLKGNSDTFDLIEDVILKEKESIELRKALLEVMGSLNLEETPNYILEYFSKTNGNFDIKKEIFKQFSDNIENSEYILFKTMNIINANQYSIQERKELLILLRKVDNKLMPVFYVNLLKKEDNHIIHNQVIENLSNLKSREELIKLNIIEIIENRMFLKETDKYTRKNLVMLLSDFINLERSRVLEILDRVYNSEEIDKFTKIFAVDILNRIAENKYLEPEISAEEWDVYRKEKY